MSENNYIQESDQAGEDRLKSLAGNKNPFKVPAGYFEEFPDRMLKMAKENNKKKSMISWQASYVRISAAAAILILFGWAMTFFINEGQVEETDITEFTAEEIIQYNFNHLAQLEEEYLLNITESDDFEFLLTADIEASDISDEEIIEYLLSENHIEYHTLTGNNY